VETAKGSMPSASTGSGASASNGRTANRGQAKLKSWIAIHEGEKQMLKRAVHRGLVLKDELAELGITPTEFARQIGVPPNRVSQIINGKRAITGDTALRFGHWFGVEPEFWLNLQNQFDLVRADRESGKIVRLLPTRADLPPRPYGKSTRPRTCG
jgi:addiction module HigA family antidote